MPERQKSLRGNEGHALLSWHNASFALPKGSVLIAGDSVNECRGFVYEHHVVGYQFHTELDEHRMNEVLERATPSLSRREQSREELRVGGKRDMPVLERWYFAPPDEWKERAGI